MPLRVGELVREASRSVLGGMALCLCTCLAGGLGDPSAFAATGTPSAESTRGNRSPGYGVTLSPEEFILWHDAVQFGVNRYGLRIVGALTASPDTSGTRWSLTFSDRHAIDLTQAWLSESIARITEEAASSGTIGQDTKRLLISSHSLRKKLEAAIEHPLWSEGEIRGVLQVRPGRVAVIDSNQAVTRIDEWDSKLTPAHEGDLVIMKGQWRSESTLVLRRVRVVEPNTLELCVMSQCPYGKRAITDVFAALDSLSPSKRPRVVVRYILYPGGGDDSLGFRSLHGKQELEEDLVQIALREVHAAGLERYLRLRASSDESWEPLAIRAGIGIQEIESARRLLHGAGRALLGREFAHVADDLEVYDGSPTFVWEGQVVRSLRDVPGFDSVQRAPGSCGQN